MTNEKYLLEKYARIKKALDDACDEALFGMQGLKGESDTEKAIIEIADMISGNIFEIGKKIKEIAKKYNV